MGWWTEYASRNSNICEQNFLLEIAVFRDGGSNKLGLIPLVGKDEAIYFFSLS